MDFANCRLCNYQSDKRLMLDVFEEPSAYAEKIDLYLGFKVSLILLTDLNLINPRFSSHTMTKPCLAFAFTVPKPWIPFTITRRRSKPSKRFCSHKSRYRRWTRLNTKFA